MAGDWIKVEAITPDKPEVFQLAEILDIDPDAVVGKLIRLWIWADQQTVDGNAKGVTKRLIDRITMVAGFADALLQTGWLDVSGDELTFPDFEKHNGKGAKKRAETNRRVSKHREKIHKNYDVVAQKREGNANNVTDCEQKALPEKRREEKSIKDKEKNNKKRKLPDDFQLNELLEQRAKTYWSERSRDDLDPVDQFDQFRAHHKSKGSTMLDWEAAWQTWYSNAVKFNPPSRGSSHAPSQYSNQPVSAVDRIREANLKRAAEREKTLSGQEDRRTFDERGNLVG